MAASLRDQLLPLVNKIRAIPRPGSGGIGTRNTVVKRIIRTWSGGRVGAGVSSDSVLTLTPNPRVNEQLNGSMMVVKWITPSPGGAQSYVELNPMSGDLTASQEVLWQVVGDFGTRTYELADIDTSAPLHWTLVLTNRERELPV